MRKFFLKLLFFILPLLLFSIYLEFNLGKIQNSYNFKRTNFEKQLGTIEVLVLGSSQVTNGVNPEYFNLKGFNLSNISQSLYYDQKLTLAYVDRMPKLKFVIINVSYFSLGNQLIDGIEAWRDYYYYQFWNINFPELDRYDLRRYSKIFLYTPKAAFSYLKQGFHINLASGFHQNGYLKVDTTNNSINISDSLGYQRVKLHDKYYRESRFNENIKELELLVRELKKRNITPVIVTPPVLSTYYKFANKTKLKRTEEVINAICLKYNCGYFNYFTDNRFVSKDFRDNDHLNFVGAEKFSKIINNEILERDGKTTISSITTNDHYHP
jgi:hypothetical protein